MKTRLTHCLCLLLLSTGFGYYLRDDFNNANNWDTRQFLYGKEGVKYPNNTGPLSGVNSRTSSVFTFAGGVLFISNRPNGVASKTSDTSDTSANGVWIGRYIFLSNFTLPSAPTVYNPFGFEVARTYCRMDYDGANAPGVRDHISIGPLLFENDNSIDRAAVNTNTNTGQVLEAFKNYPNSVSFFDYVTRDFQNDPAPYQQNHSRFGYYWNGASTYFTPAQMTNTCVGPFGNNYNLISANTAFFQYGPMGGTVANSISAPGGTNTSTIGLIMTHNGTEISLSVNPDPIDANAHPNEYYKIYTFPVNFSANLGIMLGHEVRRGDMDFCDVAYDWLLIRSSTSGTFLKVRSQDFIAGSPTPVYLSISNVMSKDDAGINLVEIQIPPELSLVAGPVVRLPANMLSGSRPLTLVSKPYSSALTSRHPLEKNEVAFRQKGNNLTLLLGQQITPERNGGPLEITLLARADRPFHSTVFHAYVNAVRSDAIKPEGRGNYSTCGQQKAYGESESAVRMSNPDLAVGKKVLNLAARVPAGSPSLP